MNGARAAVVSAVLAIALGACGRETADTLSVEALALKTQGPWTVYDNPYGDGRANPVAKMVGMVHAIQTGTGNTTVMLHVRNMPGTRGFGAHVHKLACNDNKAGGHYQNVPAPTTPTDPAYANSSNEIWLDLTTNDDGNGHAIATVSWRIRSGEAKAVVIHDQLTNHHNGTAGPKLACVDVPF
jgi:Cu-Zn family superoxide dismutase